jgi:hypothetical protein
MHENLQRMSIASSISKTADPSADVNHHIIYKEYDCKTTAGVTTLMITHSGNINRIISLRQQLQASDAGICMSGQFCDYLTRMGMDKNRLCYVNPAHDGRIPVKKTVIGLASRVYSDGRKKETYINKFAAVLDPKYTKFEIMGSGWEPQISLLGKYGFETVYYDDFDYNEYMKFIPRLDYYLYMGSDEGQMGFVDALSAGIKTIVTPQGYHLDAPQGITHSFTTYEELETILLQIQNEKSTLVNAVATWDWLNYTKKHVEIWEYLLGNKSIKSTYEDGLNSLLRMQDAAIGIDNEFEKKERKRLTKALWKDKYLFLKYYLSKLYKAQGIKGIIKIIPKGFKFLKTKF